MGTLCPSLAVQQASNQFSTLTLKGTMAMLEDAAVEKFWNTPELAEQVLPCLSARDILNLVRVGLLNIKILQKLVVWNKLIKRNFPPAAQPTFDVLMDRVDSFVAILKMMENHQPCLLATLDLICQRFPSSDITDDMVTLSWLRLTPSLSMTRRPLTSLPQWSKTAQQ